MVLLLLSIFSLLMSLKLVPYWQAKYRFEPVALDGHALAIAWAEDEGKPSEVAHIPVTVPESFQFAFPFLDMHGQVEKSALKVLVKTRLPEDALYVLTLRGEADTVTLPLARQQDGTYATPAFLAMQTEGTAHYFHGVRIFRVGGEKCRLSVERVVKL
jgi:hypothetical protein